MSKCDILIFVEDPGAANYIAKLPASLEKHNINMKLLAAGKAQNYLAQFGVIAKSTTKNAKQILAEMSPKLVLVGTSENLDTLGLQLIKQAKILNIISVAVVDGAANAKFRFCGKTNNPLEYVSDWLLLPDLSTQKLYINLGFPADKIIVCGHPHFDYVLEMAATLKKQGRDLLRKQLIPQKISKKKIIVFAAELSTGLNPIQFLYSSEYTLRGWGESQKRTNIVLEEFLDAVREIKPSPYLILRLHPKNKIEEFSQYQNYFDQISYQEKAIDIVYVADLVVGMTSIILLEAALMGIATLSIIPREQETAWLASIQMELTPFVTTKKQINSQMKELLQNGPQKLFEVTKVNSLEQTLQAILNLLNLT